VIGKISHDAASSIVMRQHRHGTRVQLDERERSYKRPTIHQVLGTMLLHQSMEGDALLKEARKLMLAYKKRKKKGLTFRGTPHDLFKAIRFTTKRGPLIPALEKILKDFPEGINTTQILEELGMSHDIPNRRRINAGLQLLDVSRLARKLPFSAATHQYHWTHRGNPIQVKYPVLILDILLELKRGPRPLMELTKPGVIKLGGKEYAHGNPGGRYVIDGISKMVSRMEKAKLIYIVKKKGHHGGYPARILELTPFAREQLDIWSRTGQFPIPLLNALLSLPEKYQK
jgi:hypothetical protein